MHTLLYTSLYAILGLAGPVCAQETAGGYLAAVFKGADPQVFLNLAPASQPSTFTPLNNGKAVLIPTTGTRGARDPYIFKTQDASKLIVLATDLDISKTTWGLAQTNGSRGIFVWESSDGITWSKDRLVSMMPATAGYVWAPSAIWDVDRSAYAVFWSSNIFAASDTAHSGTPIGPFIYYSHTTDFKTFTAPARWNSDQTATVIDQEIQWLGGRNYVRYLSDTQQVKRVVLDRSSNGLFGTWTRIGVPVDKVREGPASYQDILNPKRYYLWEDNYSGPGYECYYTENFTVPYQACAPGLSPDGMRHGAVVQVSKTMYTKLGGK
ncbi:glycoside hydrolase family 43 protein [Didymella exigua CBS 183.55]|uniref:Glycoside hydrolase family 43 protein n=1 Tax=Didymella exigua CBS 183.55 TaxID=1150837 RepID=A0A6A5R763_9PLEO|nr:glycoside hydrolase family 43 protein [Didymella exigua CBS 183.55]KAF1923050.1 glycoside hydrolase family 43 protein [Didymella exigua CBS 183.55]